MKTLWRVVATLIILSLLTLYFGHQWGGRFGLFWATMILMTFHLLSFFLGEWKLTQIFKARRIEGQDPWGLQQLLKDLCLRARIPPPQLHIMKLFSPNAFSVGRNWSKSHIILADSIMKEFSSSEIEAILALELAKIKRLDIIPLVYSSALAGGIFQWIFLKKIATGHLGFLKKTLRWILLPVVSFAVRLTFRPKEILEDDHLAAELIGDSRRIAQVLWKLESFTATRPFDCAASIAHLFTVNPLSSRFKVQYFLNQPSVEERIRRLIGSYPI